MASTEDYLGSISPMAIPFTIRNYAACDGSVVPISQNTALFSLLGTWFGGNGQSNYALPDLRSRVPIGQGQGQGLSQYELGEVMGTETVTLLTQNLPPHVHPVSLGGTGTGNVANESAGVGTPGTGGAAETLPTGSGLPFTNLQPALAVNYQIAFWGIFPTRP